MTQTWWEAPMGGSVLSFLKAEWKVSDTGSANWASSIRNFTVITKMFWRLTIIVIPHNQKGDPDENAMII